jgi:signal transduction histidine kinase
MIMKILILLLLLVCIFLLVRLRREKNQQREWLDQLRKIHTKESEKIFTRQTGLSSEIAFELNRIVVENQEEMQHYQKADQANKVLLTSLSHDVRTPLASLLGYLEALERGNLKENEAEEFISVAFRKANDLKAYIDTLFDWFKLNSNEQLYQLESVELNEFTRELVIEWLPMLEQSNIRLIADIPDNELYLQLDKFAYKRILNNLIQNAVKHGQCTEIGLQIEEKVDVVQIQIWNNGLPIPADQIPYIFERLYKVDSARSDRGSGLGLAITNELVQGLGGEILVSQSDNVQTVFRISFPNQK